MSMLLSTSSSSPLFRSSTFGNAPLSPSISPQNEDMIMDCPASPSFFGRDIPSTPTTPGAHRSSFRPPNSAKRSRRNTHAHNDPYPSFQNPRRLSAIPSDNEVEAAYRNMSDYETSGSMPGNNKRKLPTRSVFQDSGLAPPQLAPPPTFLRPPVPTTIVRPSEASAADLNRSLAQAFQLLCLEKKDESSDASSQSSPHASVSTATSYTEDFPYHQMTNQFNQPQSALPDPEELLKEIVRNSLQSLHALRLAKAMERDIRSSKTSVDDGMDMEGHHQHHHHHHNDHTGTAMQVVAYLEQSVSTINSARQYIEFAETTLCDRRDQVRDTLLKD
ncbi:hypothetical protein TWF970_004783 [Orbilia oligospora]|uniref:Uncharacterized protein n=1 Tax=Orbilia oligospora TaxID=2813651 RepID=A0A7C8R9P4_ORBOL|nr:hypothetical protein TWF970_004783 [Orbilia oligospora]